MRSSAPTPAPFLGGLLALGLFLTALPAAPVQAEGYQRIGYGRLVTNDLIGDGRDRWQTGSYASSYVFGRNAWLEGLPQRFGEVFELRLDAGLSAPEDLRTPDAGDRPLTGLLRVGLATQFEMSGWESDLGAHVSFVGPETGLVDLQTGLHDLLPGAPSPSRSVRDNQRDLDPRIGASAEVSRSFALGEATLRPFIAGEAGLETFARAGVDLSIGSFARGGLQTRDRVSGHRYRVVDGYGDGMTFVLGGDVTFVEDSRLLSEDDGVTAEARRNRLRAGLHWQRDGRHLFYGATWLSPETEEQDHGQTVGSIRIDWRFRHIIRHLSDCLEVGKVLRKN